MSVIRVIGPFPPPVHGFSAMTAKLAQHLEMNGVQVKRCDLSAKHKNGILRQIGQMKRVFQAGLSVLFGAHAPISLGCNGGLGLFYTTFIVGCARLRSMPITLHHHSYRYIYTHSRLIDLVCLLGGRGMRHVFLSPAMADAFRIQYPASQESVIITNATFVPKGVVRAPENRTSLRVGLISNLNREKGLYDFLEVAAMVRRDGISAELHLAGPISNAKDRANVEAAVSRAEIIWHGPVYGAEKDRFFTELDLFLFPTRYPMEAQPTVIYEAFAAGVPVISFDRGAIAEQVRDCLLSVPQDTQFASLATQHIVKMSKLTMKERLALSERARARHDEDANVSRSVLTNLFKTNAPNDCEGGV